MIGTPFLVAAFLATRALAVWSEPPSSSSFTSNLPPTTLDSTGISLIGARSLSNDEHALSFDWHAAQTSSSADNPSSPTIYKRYKTVGTFADVPLSSGMWNGDEGRWNPVDCRWNGGAGSGLGFIQTPCTGAAPPPPAEDPPEDPPADDPPEDDPPEDPPLADDGGDA